MDQLYQNLHQFDRPWWSAWPCWSAQYARPCWSTQSARPWWSVQSARPCWSAWPRRCSNEIEQSSFHSKLHHFITIKLLISVKPYLLSGELLDLYKSRFGQKIMVRSEPSRNSVRLNFESSSESASALEADWLTIIHLSPPNQISKSECRVLNFSLSESWNWKFLLFLKYKLQNPISVFSID